jgi:hypothetical protein
VNSFRSVAVTLGNDFREGFLSNFFWIINRYRNPAVTIFGEGFLSENFFGYKPLPQRCGNDFGEGFVSEFFFFDYKSLPQRCGNDFLVSGDFFWSLFDERMMNQGAAEVRSKSSNHATSLSPLFFRPPWKWDPCKQ